MQITASNGFLKGKHFLEEQSTNGISRLKEIEIINQSKKDIGNFRPLYEAYFHQILNYIYQKVGDKELAADITSQVFLNAMVHLKSYKIQAVPFSAWLYKIAYNESMLYFRSSKKMRVVVLDEALISGIENEIDGYSKEVILKAIESLLEKLKKDDFELIELKFYQGKTFREIGYILGCSENTAKVRSHRLMRKLRKEILKGDQYEKL